jgi:hypothetical protein
MNVRVRYYHERGNTPIRCAYFFHHSVLTVWHFGQLYNSPWRKLGQGFWSDRKLWVCSHGFGHKISCLEGKIRLSFVCLFLCVLTVTEFTAPHYTPDLMTPIHSPRVKWPKSCVRIVSQFWTQRQDLIVLRRLLRHLGPCLSRSLHAHKIN